MMHNKFKINKTQGTIIVLFLVLIFIAFYVSRIRIYEPARLVFHGITDTQVKKINVVGISPLNRTIMLNSHEWNDYSAYFRELSFSVNEDVFHDIQSIDLILNDTTYKILNNELTKTNSSKKEGPLYVLPKNIKSEFTIDKGIGILKNSKLSWGLIFLSIMSVIILLIYKFKPGIFNSYSKENIVQSGTLKKILPVIKLLFVSFLIAAILFYGFLFFKYSLATFITSILMLIFLFFVIWLIAVVIIRLFHLSKRVETVFTFVLIALFSIFLMMEIYLRINGINESYNEENNLYYASGFTVNEKYIHPEKTSDDKVYVNGAYKTMEHEYSEFSYHIQTNKDGLRDINHPVKKEDNEFRIVCIGDSFTEGVGAPQDSTWPKLLENKLVSKDLKNKITVFNAGVSSSDVFYGYYILKNSMLKYSPDMVLLGLSSSDYDFYKFRGGFERFTKDGIQYRETPSWEKFYAASYIFRFVLNNLCGYHGIFSPHKVDALNNAATKDIYKSIYRFKTFSEEQNFQLIVVFIDDNNTIYYPLKEKIKNENQMPVIDLIEYINKVLNLTDKEKAKFYWKINGHCNSDGYQMFADGIYYNLEKMGVIDSLKYE